MTIGVAPRKYARSLEPMPQPMRESSTSKSEVSRVFVETTGAKLQEWMSRAIGDLDLNAVFIDGLHFAEHVVLIALGVIPAGANTCWGSGKERRRTALLAAIFSPI